MGRKSICLTGNDVKELGKWFPANGWKLRKGKPGTDVLFTAEKKQYGVLCVQKSASNNPRKPYEIRVEKSESANLAHVVINSFRKDMNRENRNNEPPKADSVSFFPGRPLTEKEQETVFCLNYNRHMIPSWALDLFDRYLSGRGYKSVKDRTSLINGVGYKLIAWSNNPGECISVRECSDAQRLKGYCRVVYDKGGITKQFLLDILKGGYAR